VNDLFLELAYSLIHQLVGLLPPILDKHTAAIPERFDTLNESSSNWTKALELLRDMLVLAPPLLSCIIDGVHTIDESSAGQIHQLMEIFRLTMKLEGRIFKILFTTSGRSRLVCELSGNEMVIIEGASSSGGLPGAPQLGTRLFAGK
jgi:hypothetical protein